MRSWGKLITAMVTPFSKDGSIDYGKAGAMAETIIENGSDAVVVAGTTGESATLYTNEKIKLFKTVKYCVGDKGAVIAGTGSNFTAESARLSAEAESAGVDGLLLVVPYYNKPPQEGLYEHFKKIAAATSLPVMLYNVPGRTSCNLLPETVARLAEIPNVRAIKEASGNLGQAGDLLRLLPQDFEIFCGDDALTLPMLSLGAAGVVSVAGHIAGGTLKKMIRLFELGEHRKAAEMHIKLLPLFEAMFINTNPIPVKEMLNQLAVGVGSCRLPLIEATPREKEKIAICLEHYKDSGLLDDMSALTKNNPQK